MQGRRNGQVCGVGAVTAIGGDGRESAAIERLRERLTVSEGFTAGGVDAAVEWADHIHTCHS